MHMLLMNLATIYQGGPPTLRHSQTQAEQLSRIQLRYTLTGDLDPLTTHIMNELRKLNTAHPWATYPNRSTPQYVFLLRDSPSTKTKFARQNSKRDTPHSLTQDHIPKKKINFDTQHTTIIAYKPNPPHAPTKITLQPPSSPRKKPSQRRQPAHPQKKTNKITQLNLLQCNAWNPLSLLHPSPTTISPTTPAQSKPQDKNTRIHDTQYPHATLTTLPQATQTPPTLTTT